jgi:hypothetical protein
MALKGRRFIWRQFGSDTLASDEEMASLFALQPILTVGYPIGISDTANNMPVFRQGVAATHPSLDFEGRKEFLIDAACYPGCSGSPVVLYEPGLNIEGDDHIKVTGPRGRLMLLGVVYGGFEDSVEGKVKVVPVPTRLETVVESRVPIHLGAVIKAERLLDFGPLLAETILRRNGK